MTDDADEFIDQLTDPFSEEISKHIEALWNESDFNSQEEALAAIKNYLISIYGPDAEIVVEADRNKCIVLVESDE